MTTVSSKKKTKSKLKKVGILGAGGFTGKELIRILRWHPYVELTYVSSSLNKGKTVCDVFPGLELEKYNQLCFSEHPASPEDIPQLDVLLFATADTVSLKWIPILIDKFFCIDLSGCFRLSDNYYYSFYGEHHPHPGLSNNVIIYGLPEWNRENITKATSIANPGCYPTSILLSLLPLTPFAEYLQGIILIDSKSGTSGAGARQEQDKLTFSTVNDNFKAYNMNRHKHSPEILQYSRAILERDDITIRFTPHLLPIFRGILSQIYIPLKKKLSLKVLNKIDEAFFETSNKECFFRYYKNYNNIEVRHVQYSNFIDISFWYDEATNILQIVSCIDNLVKGAAGQAIQNMNLALGFHEKIALYK